jgi:hypothetical protein
MADTGSTQSLRIRDARARQLRLALWGRPHHLRSQDARMTQAE